MKQKVVEKTIYVIVATIIAIMLFIAVIPRTIIHAPYRDAFVVKTGPVFDTVVFDDNVFLTKHNDKRRRLSIVRCRRVFEVGLFGRKEISPECGI